MKNSRHDISYDPLDTYLRQIGDIEVLSPVEQKQISSEIEENERLLQTQLAGFGFAASEYLRLIDLCLSGTNRYPDIFRPSSLRQLGEPAELPAIFSCWRKEIAAALTKRRKAFAAGKATERSRKNLEKILSRCTLNYSLIDEQKEIFSGYLHMASPSLGEKEEPDAFDFTGVPEERRKLLEEKLLIPVSELPAAVTTVFTVAKRLTELRGRMVEGNLRLVISIAQKYRNRGIPFGDLIQEGNLGMLKALDRFDFQLGYRFTTYASWWIRHNITHTILQQGRVIRLPGHMVKAIREINRAEQQFIQLNGREPENGELAKLLELPVARVSAIRKMAMQPISLQATIGNEEDGSVLEDMIASDKGSDPTEEITRKLLYDRLHDMLRTLPEREQQIIIMRFGFFGFPCMPHTEISRRFHLTRERIRQLESKILAKLRSPEKLQYIDGTRDWEG